MLLITKISISSENTVRVVKNWHDPETGSKRKRTLKDEIICEDSPKLSFKDALAAFNAYATNLMALTPDQKIRTRVSGVSITYKIDLGSVINTGLVVTCLQTLPDESVYAPLVLNTPCLFERLFHEDDAGAKWSTFEPQMNRLLDTLIAEAEAYLDGNREEDNEHQLSLLEGPAEAKQDPVSDAVSNFHEAVNAPGISGVTVSIPSAGESFDVRNPEGMTACVQAIASNMNRKREASLVG